MKKSGKIFGAAVAAVFAVVLCVTLALNFITLAKVSTIEVNTQKPLNNTENGVVIADRYEVISTSQISDAYISGDSSALDERDKNAMKTASDILDKIIKDDMTEYEKELAVYNWIFENIRHDEDILVAVQDPDADTFTAQGVLAGRRAVCVGYAVTFRLFMNMLGIDCMVVHDDSLVHTWNLVKIDGGWYHTDLFFDAPTMKYNHFNLSDTLRKSDYDWDTELYPAAENYEYCYAVLNAAECKDVYELPSKIRTALDKKKPFVSYRFKNADSTTKAIAERIVDTIQELTTDSSEFGSNYIEYNNIRYGKDLIFAISITIPVDESDVTISDEKILDKIQAKVDEAFGDLEPSGEDNENGGIRQMVK